MTFDEANKIFKNWQRYMEINDKMSKIFNKMPESFLPYPVDILEEALNIIARKYFDDGNKKMSNNIQNTIAFLLYYDKDKTAIESMRKELNFIFEHPELIALKLEILEKSRDSWAKINK